MGKGFGIIIVSCTAECQSFCPLGQEGYEKSLQNTFAAKYQRQHILKKSGFKAHQGNNFFPSKTILEEANKEATPDGYKALQNVHQLPNVITNKLKQKCHEEGSGLLSDNKVQKNRSTSQNTVGH